MWPFDIKRKKREAAARAEEERQEGLRRLHQQAMDALARQGLSPTGRRRSEPPPARQTGKHPGLSAPYGASAGPAPGSRRRDESEVYLPGPALYDTPHIHQHYSAPTPTPSPCPSPSYGSGSSSSDCGSSDSGSSSSCGGCD